MPPTARITRERILDEAFALVRKEGHEALTVRRLATALGCSTQPILYQFESIAQLREETYRRADACHTAFLTDGLESEASPLLALGLRYIRFGAEESRLFRFLFQSGHFHGRTPEELAASPEVAPLSDLMGAAAGLDREAAAALFQALFIAAHGYASLLANNAMRWEPQAAEALLVRLFEGLTHQGGTNDENTL